MSTLPKLRELIWLLIIGLLPCADANGQYTSFENPPINYQTADVDDAVARLTTKLKSGEVKLKYEQQHGYLKSVLDALEVPISSQALVFSKTSLQSHRISPRRPRAIYFSDDVYVGWCQKGDIIEIAATDAQQGPTFYTLEQSIDKPPKFVRDQGQCIVCHASSRTQNIPGFLVRSVFVSRSGHPHYGSGTYTTDHTSPFEQRWGGWYVTGSHGSMRHMGNKIFAENERTQDLQSGANRKSLEELVSTKPYLAPHSDIVALMVLEHQTQMQNAITFANYETRQALHQSDEMNKILDRKADFMSESTERRINAAAERVVSHLLMCDEFPLQGHVSGTSQYADTFSKRGIRDSKNRSLRDLDLKNRLFRYPCSFLIYSPAFDELPEEVRKPIIARMFEILKGVDQSKTYAHLSSEMRREILEILRETKAEFSGTKP